MVNLGVLSNKCMLYFPYVKVQLSEVFIGVDVDACVATRPMDALLNGGISSLHPTLGDMSRAVLVVANCLRRG